MSNISLLVECPKCGSKDIHLPAGPEPGSENQLICGACGHRAEEVNFVAKQAALDKAAELLSDRLSRVPGFRKK